MVMLMIKFGAYKAACCWVCAPSFSRRQQLMTRREERRDDLGERENKAKKSGFRTKTALLPSFFRLLLSFSPPSPPPQEGSFFSLYERGGRGRERDAGTTENASVTDDSEKSSDDE